MCKIWVDDIREVPEGYIGTKFVNETISLIKRLEAEGQTIDLTDNGAEFKNPWDIEKDSEGRHRCYVFYCDPYASNQKGKLEKNHEQ